MGEEDGVRMDLRIDEGNLEDYGVDDQNGILVELFAEGVEVPKVSFVVGHNVVGGSSFVRLKDSDATVRVAALESLGELEPASLVSYADANVTALGDRDSTPDVRKAALGALVKLEPAALAKVAKDADEVRASHRSHVRRFTPPLPDAVQWTRTRRLGPSLTRQPAASPASHAGR